MIKLELINPQWIVKNDEQVYDLCAHGSIEFVVNDLVISTVEDEVWTVSAAAFYLLHSIFFEHIPERNPIAVGNYLLPCCGFNIYPMEGGRFPYDLPGCSQGIDPTIEHVNGWVQITLGENQTRISQIDWAKAILDFSNQVERFYDRSLLKVYTQEDAEALAGWKYFWEQWRSLKLKTEGLIGSHT